jgi:hypothetical protein
MASPTVPRRFHYQTVLVTDKPMQAAIEHGAAEYGISKAEVARRFLQAGIDAAVEGGFEVPDDFEPKAHRLGLAVRP